MGRSEKEKEERHRLLHGAQSYARAQEYGPIFLKKIKRAGTAQRDKSLVSTLNFKRNIWNYFEDLTNELLSM